MVDKYYHPDNSRWETRYLCDGVDYDGNVQCGFRLVWVADPEYWQLTFRGVSPEDGQTYHRTVWINQETYYSVEIGDQYREQ